MFDKVDFCFIFFCFLGLFWTAILLYKIHMCYGRCRLGISLRGIRKVNQSVLDSRLVDKRDI
jgi:hypothetical protein